MARVVESTFSVTSTTVVITASTLTSSALMLSSVWVASLSSGTISVLTSFEHDLGLPEGLDQGGPSA